MLVTVEALAGRLHPDQRDVSIGHEVAEHADGVRSAPDTGDDRVREPPLHLQHLRAGLAADDALKLPDHRREGMRAGGRAEEIVRVGKAGGPVAERLVDGVLQGPATAGHGYDLGAHQLHAEDVELLPGDIVGAHVDFGFEAEQCPGEGGGNAVLAGAGFGDHAALAHAPCEQGLGQHLIGLVRAAVEQVLALEVDAGWGSGAKVAAECQRRGPAGIGGEQMLELGGEAGVLLGLQEGRFELLERRHQDFGHVAAAVAAEPSIVLHAALRSMGRRASNKACTIRGSFRPGSASSREPTSIP